MIRNKLLQYLSVVLGLVYLASGLGKVLQFPAFAAAVGEVLRAGGTVSSLLGGTIVLIELLGGTAILLRHKIAVAAPLLFLMTSVVVWALWSAAVTGNETRFGIGLGLSDRKELVVDIVLLNLIVLVLLLSEWKKDLSFNQWALSAAVFATFLFLEFAVLGPLLEKTFSAHPADIFPAIRHAETISPPFSEYRAGNRLLFLLSFPDFQCPPCFDDFMILCDALKAAMPAGDSIRLFGFFKPGDLADPQNPARLLSWTRASGLKVPVAIGPDSLFTQMKFLKSSVTVISPSGRILFHEVLPIGGEHRARVVELLTQSYGRP